VTSTGARRLGVGALAPALGAAAHVEAGGGLPELTPPVLVVGFLTAGLAALAVRRRIGVVRLTLVLAAGQVGWHLTMGDAHVGHAMAHGMSPAAPSPGMVAAHAVATLLVVLGAAGADRAVATMLAARVGALLSLLGPGPLVPAAPPVRHGRPPVVAAPITSALLRVRPLRGPPVRPAVA
jgi:hypothetical protein